MLRLFSIPSKIPTSLPDNVNEELLSHDEDDDDVDDGAGFNSDLDDEADLPPFLPIIRSLFRILLLRMNHKRLALSIRRRNKL
jgi:hypothetical protein